MLTKVEPKMGSHREKMMAIVEPGNEKIEVMRMACLQMAEACLKSKVRTSELKVRAKHEKVPKGEAIVKPVRALKELCGYRSLAAERL